MKIFTIAVGILCLAAGFGAGTAGADEASNDDCRECREVVTGLETDRFCGCRARQRLHELQQEADPCRPCVESVRIVRTYTPVYPVRLPVLASCRPACSPARVRRCRSGCDWPVVRSRRKGSYP